MRSEIAKSRAGRVIERIEAGGSKIMDSLLDVLDALAVIAFVSQGAIRAAEINPLIVTLMDVLALTRSSSAPEDVNKTSAFQARRDRDRPE